MKYFLIITALFLFLIGSSSGIFSTWYFKFFLFFFYFFCYLTLSELKFKEIFKGLGRLNLFFLLLLIVSLFRTNAENQTYLSIFLKATNFLFLLLAVKEFILKCNDNNYEKIKILLLIPLILFAGLNFITYFVFNLQPFDLGEQQELGFSVLIYSLFGVLIERVNFPFISSVTTFGLLMGYLFIVSFYLRQRIKYKILAFLGILFSVIGILLVDHRSGVFSLIVSVLMTHVAYKLRINLVISKLIVLISLFGPFLMVAISQILISSSFGEIISRDNAELSTGNSRFIIWLIGLEEILDFKWLHVFGFGEIGTYGAGISFLWANFFEKFADPLRITAHNLYLNVFFDMGYIGVITMFSLFFFLYKKTYLVSNISKLFFCFLTFFLISGITESPIGFHSAITTLVFSICTLFLTNLNQANAKN